MDRRRKTLTLIGAGIAIVAMLLLAAALAGVDLTDDRPFTFEDLLLWLWQWLWRAMTQPVNLTLDRKTLMGFLRILFLLALLLLPVAILYFIMSPEFRKKVLRNLLALLLFIVIFELLRRSVILETIDEEFVSGPQAPSLEIAPVTPLEVESVPPASRFLVLGVSVTLALATSALLVRAGWSIWQRRRRRARAVERLASEARLALDDLRAGGELRDTVLRCYRRMSEVVREERGLRRNQALTPREFEQYLERNGLPGTPVHDLTRLFEKVRYGTHLPDEEDEHRAIASLNAIVEACKGIL